MTTTLTREQLLVLLIEECAEVIHAATKCLRFGFDHDEPGYGVNSEKLACECGELDAVIDALPLDARLMFTAKREKIYRAEAAAKARAGDDNTDVVNKEFR